MLTRTYRLTPAFYWDHVARDLPAGVVVRETKRHVHVEMDRATYDELVSDSRHYAYAMAAGGFDGYGLIASARATLRQLLAAPFPPEIDCCDSARATGGAYHAPDCPDVRRRSDA